MLEYFKQKLLALLFQERNITAAVAEL